MPLLRNDLPKQDRLGKMRGWYSEWSNEIPERVELRRKTVKKEGGYKTAIEGTRIEERLSRIIRDPFPWCFVSAESPLMLPSLTHPTTAAAAPLLNPLKFLFRALTL
jgi:hypothetical protein